MAFVHSQSCECTKSELDLFAIPPTQTSIESSGYVEYNPISAIADGTPIEFHIGGAGQDYIDLANSQLFVRASIVMAEGTPINDQPVAPVNLFLHSLFTEVDLKLNDTLVTSTNNTYPYRAYLETLLTYGPGAKESQLSCALFYKDAAFHMAEAIPRAENVRNMGLVQRHGHINEGMDMVGRINADLFFQDKYLPSDIGLRLRLVRSKSSFALMSSANAATFGVKIRECKFYVRKVRLSPSVFLAHAKAMEVGNAKYPIRPVVCKTFTIPTGNLDFSQENLFSGQLPTRLVLTCVDNDTFNGSYRKNPFNFKHYSLTQLKVYLDGQQQHHVLPIETNYNENKYIMAYSTLFSGTGKLNRDEGNQVTRRDFPGGYAIYAFDLTPDLAEPDHFNLIKDVSVRIDMKFANALPNTINVIAYAEFENVIEIDRSRNVIFDYRN